MRKSTISKIMIIKYIYSNPNSLLILLCFYGLIYFILVIIYLESKLNKLNFLLLIDPLKQKCSFFKFSYETVTIISSLGIYIGIELYTIITEKQPKVLFKIYFWL